MALCGVVERTSALAQSGRGSARSPRAGFLSRPRFSRGSPAVLASRSGSVAPIGQARCGDDLCFRASRRLLLNFANLSTLGRPRPRYERTTANRCTSRTRPPATTVSSARAPRCVRSSIRATSPSRRLSSSRADRSLTRVLRCVAIVRPGRGTRLPSALIRRVRRACSTHSIGRGAAHRREMGRVRPFSAGPLVSASPARFLSLSPLDASAIVPATTGTPAPAGTHWPRRRPWDSPPFPRWTAPPTRARRRGLSGVPSIGQGHPPIAAAALFRGLTDPRARVSFAAMRYTPDPSAARPRRRRSYHAFRGPAALPSLLLPRVATFDPRGSAEGRRPPRRPASTAVDRAGCAHRARTFGRGLTHPVPGAVALAGETRYQ